MHILVVEDERSARMSIRAVLRGEPDFEVVGVVENGETAIAAVAVLAPDLVTMDATLPGMSGVEATRTICARLDGKTRVLGVSAGTDRESVLALLAAGAGGFVAKHRIFDELVTAVRTVLAGYRYISADVDDVSENPPRG